MTEDKISNDAFASCLRQLVINCETIIRDADSIQSVQESLQRLEENDENFYKYELIKLLKLQLNDKLGAYIDETIEQYPANRVDLNHAEMIDSMTSKLIYSTEYLKLSKKFKTIVSNATECLLSKYDTEIGSKLKLSPNSKINILSNSQKNWFTSKSSSSNNSHKIATSFKQSQQEAQAIFNDNHLFSLQSSDEESSSSSFFNPESCVFLNQEEMATLAEDLDGKKKSIAKRQEALMKLLKIPVVDIHCWDVLGPGLIDSLNESELYPLAIKFIAKGFISTPSNIKALYCTLVKQLEILFTIKKYQLPTFKSGIDIRRNDIQRIMISLRLINEFQQNAIHFWVRYSEKFLEDIMESTLKLFSISSNTLSLDSRLTPLHFLSIIDPKAEWLIKWTHGTYSRNPLLRNLSKYVNILEESVNCCMRYFSVYNNLENKLSQLSFGTNTELSEPNSMYYSAAHLDYLYFIHSINIVVRTLAFKSYRLLLEEVLLRGSNSIPSFMCSLLVFWFKTPELPVNNCVDLDIHTICYSITKSIVQDKKACKKCFNNKEFLAEIFRFLSPLKNFHTEELNAYLSKYQNTLCRLCDILSEMIQYKNIQNLFLNNPQKILMPQSAIELIGDIIHKNLTEKQFLSFNLLIKLISIVCQFYTGCTELHSIWSLNIQSDLVKAWKEAEEHKDRCTTPTKDKTTRKIFQILSWEESLSENLLWLAKTRRGVLFLEKHNAVSACLQSLVSKTKSNSIQMDRLSLGNVDLVINQIASTKSGIQALVSVGIVQKLILEISSLTECDPDDLPTYQGCIWPIQSMNIACLKPLVKLIAIHSSYSAFHSLIHDQVLPMEDCYSFREIPKTLITFIDRLVIVNKSSKITGLFNYESSHLCGLCWLSATATNLNCLLLLESQFQFISCLIDSQNENKSGNNEYVIIDALSVERHNIILKSSFLAGPSERILLQKRAFDITNKDILSLKYSSNFSSKDYFRYLPIISKHHLESHLINIIRNYMSNQQHLELSLSNLQSLYLEDIKSNNVKYYSSTDIMTLLDIISVEKLKCTTYEIVKSSFTSKIGKFTKFEELGINMVIEYGKNLQILSEKNSDILVNNFKSVLTNAKSWNNKNPNSNIFNRDELGFDWFTGCVFLLFQGNEMRSIEFLFRFNQHFESILIWPIKSFVDIVENPLLLYICHWIEIIIASQCPAVHSSFQICEYPLTEICSMWFSQCFLNIFDWSNIVTFITSNVVIGPTFLIYFTVSLLNHLEPKIKARLHNNDLIIFIREVIIDDFDLCEKLDEILRYQLIYDEAICNDLKSIYDCAQK